MDTYIDIPDGNVYITKLFKNSTKNYNRYFFLFYFFKEIKFTKKNFKQKFSKPKYIQ